MRRDDQFPPLVCFQDGETLCLAEGFHRAAAYRMAEIEEVKVEIHVGTRRDAILHAVGSNARRWISLRASRRAISRKRPGGGRIELESVAKARSARTRTSSARPAYISWKE